MLSGFFVRRGLIFIPIFLLIAVFIGCGMMSVLVDEEDAGEEISDAESSSDASKSDADGTRDSCGDGIIQGRLGEVCDGENLGGATCRSLGKGTGLLRCTGNCEFDLSMCTSGDIPGDGGVIRDGGTSWFGDGGSRWFRDGGQIIF
ncbi:MAG: hypothetical protein JXA30_10420 [Deltaproteobacteria bacterium]|nr:hypothetical protein [Deltaproteobacteria bacterium]